jgi:hypothetical protein
VGRRKKGLATAQGTTAARLGHICELMRTLQFQRGKTAKLLAAKWGLTPNTVAHLTAEASKIVRAEVMNPEHVSATVGTYLEWGLAQAKKTRNLRAIEGLAKQWAIIAGAVAPQEIKHSGAIGGDPPKRIEVVVCDAATPKDGDPD